MKTNVLPVCLLVTSLFMGAALAGEAEVRAAEVEWARAVTTNDFDALEKILADDLYYSHSNFLEDTKREYIDNLKTGKARYYRVDAESTKVQMVDDHTALAMSVAVYETKAPDGSRQISTLKTLHVFRKNGGQWQLLAHQSARKTE